MSRARRDSLIWRRDELALHFTFDEDRIDGGGWYSHREHAAERSYDRSYLRAPVNASGRVYLISRYRGSSWIFHEQIAVRVGARVLRSARISPLSSSSERDNSGRSVWETLHFSAAGSDGGILNAIASAKPTDSVFVRQSGQQDYDEFDLELRDRRAITEAVELARLIRMVGRTSAPTRPRPSYIMHLPTLQYFVHGGQCDVKDEELTPSRWEQYASRLDAEYDSLAAGTEAECAQLLAKYREPPPSRPTVLSNGDPRAPAAPILPAMPTAADAAKPAGAPVKPSTERTTGDLAGTNNRQSALVGTVAADNARRIYFRPGCREESASLPQNRITFPSDYSAEKKGYRRSEVPGC